MNTASLGYWCIPPTPLPDQMRTFKVYLLTQMEATVRKRGRAEVSQGVATLFKRRLHTNQRMQKQTLLGLVAFKPAEISCNSIQFLTMFVLAHTHTHTKRLHSACPFWLLGIKARHFSHSQLHFPSFLQHSGLFHFLSLALASLPTY